MFRRVPWGDLVELARSGLNPVEIESTGRPSSAVWVIELDDVEESLWRDPAAERLIRSLAVSSAVRIGVSQHALPAAAQAVVESLTCTLAPSGPGSTWVRVNDSDAILDLIERRVARAPGAATTLATMLPITDRLPVPEALVVESAHYSMLLAGPEHAAWRARVPARTVPVPAEPVVVSRSDNQLLVELNVPHRHNAFSRWVRDGLYDALELAQVDPDLRVVLSGRGPSFCSGGDLDEFGSTPDVVAAYSIRLARSAGLAVHRVAERVTARVHGAAVGAGVEVAAFAGTALAGDSAWFCLPELELGLIPGAGGTVSLPRRIGRWRTAWMVLTGARVEVTTALEWGLVDGRL